MSKEYLTLNNDQVLICHKNINLTNPSKETRKIGGHINHQV